MLVRDNLRSMTSYIRPHIEPDDFFDAQGERIDYGNRWAHLDGPPEDSYSVDEHPERFAPLHAVADALIAHLVTTYAVDVEEGAHVAADFRHPTPADAVVRAVRFTPRHEASASMTVLFTAYPGVRVRAGMFFEEAFPSCGCDACDETWDAAAEELEQQVLSIAGGGLTEKVGKPRRRRVGYSRAGGFVVDMGQTVSHSLVMLDDSGSSGGGSAASDLTAPELAAAAAALRAVAEASPAGNWLPWPARPQTDAASIQ